jgi:hypothetical protein
MALIRMGLSTAAFRTGGTRIAVSSHAFDDPAVDYNHG